jgi:hypothetical protein
VEGLKEPNGASANILVFAVLDQQGQRSDGWLADLL